MGELILLIQIDLISLTLNLGFLTAQQKNWLEFLDHWHCKWKAKNNHSCPNLFCDFPIIIYKKEQLERFYVELFFGYFK